MRRYGYYYISAISRRYICATRFFISLSAKASTMIVSASFSLAIPGCTCARAATVGAGYVKRTEGMTCSGSSVSTISSSSAASGWAEEDLGWYPSVLLSPQRATTCARRHAPALWFAPPTLSATRRGAPASSTALTLAIMGFTGSCSATGRGSGRSTLAFRLILAMRCRTRERFVRCFCRARVRARSPIASAHRARRRRRLPRVLRGGARSAISPSHVPM